ncbi:PPC domain-containing DNA-binding protein, partial [Thermodesulfobacteriota bacterium]
RKVEAKETTMGKLRHGADLLEEITGICKDRGIRLGRVEAIGAVSRACVGYYNQETREYEFHTLDEPLEIVSLKGNISIKDGEPMVHAHVTLADRAGKAFGGHLAAGTIVFACEWVIEAFEGPAFERGYDEETGLPLWTMEE